jgi:hypothetical protein
MDTYAAEQEIANRLEDILVSLDRRGHLDDSQEIVPLGTRQATVIVTIDGERYSLTLTKED